MKKLAAAVKNIILSILLLPVMAVFLVWLFLATPFDYLKYKRTRYYIDTRAKYSWLCTTSSYIELYDLIKKENLPVDYYRCEFVPLAGYGYFVYRDILILNDYNPCYDLEKNIWTEEIEDEYVDLKEDVERTIDKCNDFLKEKICKRAAVLIDGDIYDEHPDVKYELFDLVPVYDNNVVDALKKVIRLVDENE